MLTKSILAAGAVLSLAAAVPMNKRDIVWVTATQEDIVTVDVTTTVWLEPGETPPAYHHHQHHHKSTYTSHIKSTVTVPAYSPSSPAETSLPVPESSYVAPTPSSVATTPTTSAYVAPTTTSSAYVAPTTTAVETTPTPSAYSSAAPQPSASAAPASPSGGSHTGDLTYYTPGLGSCGWTSTGSDLIVALAEDMMEPEDGANPNDNPLCGRMITISYGGATAQAKIVDTCPGCSGAGLDLSPTLFQKFAALGVGRLTGATWSYS